MCDSGPSPGSDNKRKKRERWGWRRVGFFQVKTKIMGGGEFVVDDDGGGGGGDALWNRVELAAERAQAHSREREREHEIDAC